MSVLPNCSVQVLRLRSVQVFLQKIPNTICKEPSIFFSNYYLGWMVARSNKIVPVMVPT